MRNERLISHNLIVAVGTFGAGLLGVAFQVIISHRLRPADYGSVFAVMTVLTLIATPSAAFTLLTARQASHDRGAGESVPSASLLRGGNIVLVLCGAALSAAMAALSGAISRSLSIPADQLTAMLVGIPFTLGLALVLGELQGEQRFAAYAALSAGQAALKLIAAIALGIVFGPVGIIAGISLATLIAYAAGLLAVRNTLRIQATARWIRPALSYLAMVLPSTLALAVLLSTDVLMVKHYFTSQSAGQYAAVAALGRVIFWGASAVAAVLFPKVAYRAVRGHSNGQLVIVSILLVAIGGVVGFAAFTEASGRLLTAFAGAAYSGGAAYLPLYALAMTLLGSVAVLIATYQSRTDFSFLAILLPIAVLEPLLIAALHGSLFQVVQVVVATMAVLVAGLGALLIVRLRDAPSRKSHPAALMPPATAAMKANQ